MARRAGIAVARKATTPSSAATAQKVKASVALTPNSRLAITRVRSAAAHQPHGDAEGRQLHPLPHDQPENIPRLGAQSHAHTDIVRALRHQVRHYAVDSHRRQQQGECRERPQHHAREALPCHRLVDSVLHAANVIHYGIRIHFTDLRELPRQ